LGTVPDGEYNKVGHSLPSKVLRAKALYGGYYFIP
jgi:hypothetical protein